MPKIILEERISKINDNENTIIRKIYKTKNSDCNYFKLDSSNINDILELNLNLTDYKLLLYISNMMDYDNIIVLTDKHINNLVDILQVTKKTITRHVNLLCKFNLLKPLKFKNEYIINPMYIYKQSIAKRLEIIDLYNNH